MTVRDNLLMMLDESIQIIYEDQEQDYKGLSLEFKRIVDALESAAATIRREL